MGWIWASNKSQDTPQDNLQNQAPPPPSAESPSETLRRLPPPSPNPAEAQPRPPPTREEAADADFRAFLLDVASEVSSSSPSDELFANSPFPITNVFSVRPPTPTTTTSSDDEIAPSPSTADLPSDRKITPARLHPTTLFCRAAFDAAFYCQSLGGQFNAVYHYGTIRDCSPLWSQFWFCVKTNRRRMGDEERQGRVLEHYRLREMKYRVGPSSEDVWVQRDTMLVGAFEGDLEAAMADEEKRSREGGEE